MESASYLEASLGRRCTIDVDISPGTQMTQSTWFDIWAAGIEIQTLCVEHGFNGTVSGLGKLISDFHHPGCLKQGQ